MNRSMVVALERPSCGVTFSTKERLMQSRRGCEQLVVQEGDGPRPI